MRITADVSGYYDWAPCPPGTQITQADVSALRVKQMSDGQWHMRVERTADTHHDTGIHEEAICQRLASLERLGRPSTREAVVAEMLRESFRHHVHGKHLRSIHVQDDGPAPELFRSALSAHEIDGERANEVVGDYAGAVDMEQYLNAVFRTTAPAKEKS